MRFQLTERQWSGLRRFYSEKKRTETVCLEKYVTICLLGGAVSGSMWEDIRMKSKEYCDHKKLQRTYLDGLRRYKSKGVRILVDGIECPEKEWDRIFELGEDGGFYMGDYVGAEQGCLKEIRFDKVYLCMPPNKSAGGER